MLRRALYARLHCGWAWGAHLEAGRLVDRDGAFRGFGVLGR